MKEQIYKICTQLNDGQIAVVEAQEQLLLLFSVSGQSEQLCRIFFPDGKTTSATKCQFCGKQKWEH